MKGPGLRHDLDVRRVWRCTKCGKVVRTPGHVTAQRCGCSDPARWMHLEPAVKKEPFRAPVREHLPEPWEIEILAAPNTPQPAELQAANQPEPPVVENTPQPADPPGPGLTPVVVTEVLTTETIIEVVEEVAATGPADPQPDEFGTGVDDPPRNPAET